MMPPSEQELDRSLAGQKMIVLCTYSLQASRFHRANVMQKLGAKNTADLVRRVLGE